MVRFFSIRKSKRIISAAHLALLFAASLLSSCSAAVQSAAQPAAPSRMREQIVEEERKMQYYIDSYNDMHAALVLRQMFEAGEITQETYTGGYAAAGDALDVLHIHELHKAASVLNGRLSGLSQKSLLKFSLILSELMKTSPVMISIFSDQSQRDEVENAVKVIDTWALMPGDGNTKAMEDVLLSQRLSCGAKVYLYCYLTAASSRVESVMYNGEKYAPAYYIESRLDGWFTEALFELLLENNTPKENAAGQTYGF